MSNKKNYLDFSNYMLENAKLNAWGRIYTARYRTVNVARYVATKFPSVERYYCGMHSLKKSDDLDSVVGTYDTVRHGELQYIPNFEDVVRNAEGMLYETLRGLRFRRSTSRKRKATLKNRMNELTYLFVQSSSTKRKLYLRS
jgi:hypothetical protein